MASAVALKTGRVNQALDAGPLALPSPTACTVSGTSACARNWLRAALAVSASSTPLRVRP